MQENARSGENFFLSVAKKKLKANRETGLGEYRTSQLMSRNFVYERRKHKKPVWRAAAADDSRRQSVHHHQS